MGEGEFPLELDRVNFGAFLLAVIWAPFHRLWAWFGVFVVLEVLESAMGLGALRFFGGVFEQPAAMVAFRIVYWTVTVVFALRANRLVWTEERKRAARAEGVSPSRSGPPSSRGTPPTSVSWTLVGLILLVATPLSLLIGFGEQQSEAPSSMWLVTVGIQAILLVGLWGYDRLRIAHRQTQA